MNRRTRTKAWLRHSTLAVACTACTFSGQAQPVTDAATKALPAAFGLRQAFDAAWARQPEALALPARRDAVRAQQRAAQSWTPEPLALEAFSKTDRLTDNQGTYELEVGVVVPMWLPGERSGSAALAAAEGAAAESRASATQLRVAATVRDAWWRWQRARIEVEIARDQLDSTRRIAADVARRTKAGDLARADQHQADGAVAGAESRLAQAEAGLAASQQHLRALAGQDPRAVAATGAAPEPDPGVALADVEVHAALLELQDRVEVAERTAALASAQSRGHPEILLGTTRERSTFGESPQQTLTVGVRIPFGGGARHEARIANARAEATEFQAQLALERERLTADREAARIRVQACRVQLAAAERRLQLARESRGFFDKSFRLGETDLPTRLRIEAEAAEAERQAASTRIELAAAISALRQALGLLPQ
jgi:cobalt-zinc-cadmium efflux system outer membrane protein